MLMVPVRILMPMVLVALLTQKAMEPIIGKAVGFKPHSFLMGFGRARGLKLRMIGKEALKSCYRMMGPEPKVLGGIPESEQGRIFLQE